MSNIAVFAYCAAMGFVAAATIATLYQWITSEAAELFSAKASMSALAFTVVLCMFCGPFIVMRKIVAGLRARELTVLPALIGTAIAGMWSVCAGIFYVSLLLAA